jgi:predicted acyltransferase
MIRWRGGAAGDGQFEPSQTRSDLVLSAAGTLTRCLVQHRLAAFHQASTSNLEQAVQQEISEPTVAPDSQRIVSIDALRGFDMFWIVGGTSLVSTLLPFCGESAQKILRPQLEHAAWEGFTFTDLIFPLFVFMVGMSTVFSLTKALTHQGKAGAYRRILRRAPVLFLLGIYYSHGLSHCWPDVRLMGVLQRIALCYLFTGVLSIHFRTRGMLIAAVLLLGGYWAWLSFVPVPGVGGVSFEPGKNWSNYLDARFLPGLKYDGTWDPEGYFSTLPAIATCILGALAAQLLRNQRLSQAAKVGCLIGGGALLLALGYAWGTQFPIIKKIWTSSYVLVAGGYSCILTGFFYLIIDVWKLHRWAIPFLWIGTNAIAVYMLPNMVPLHELAQRLVGGDVQVMVGPSFGQLLLTAVALGYVLIVAWFLHRNKIMLRV